MNRRELVNAVAGHTGQGSKEVDATIRGLVDVIIANVAKGEIVSIPGFAKFSKRQTKARMGRNPQTGEPVKIPARTKARITPLKTYKDVVLGVQKAPKIGVAPAAPAKKAAPAKAAKKTAKKAAPKKAATKKAAPAKAAKKTAKKATKRR
ncbi:MAG TPA: HU family DNA-binding protein [Acidimicrobiales bacterium]|nr:HU family DNA-binding protein [Acidimicrobiales bacterium]